MSSPCHPRPNRLVFSQLDFRGHVGHSAFGARICRDAGSALTVSRPRILQLFLDLLNLAPKPARDLIEVAIAVGGVAAVEAATGWLNANPTAFGAWTGVVVILLGIVRRALAPDPEPIAHPSVSFARPVLANYDPATFASSLDQPTPEAGTPVVKLHEATTVDTRDDIQFVDDCVAQIPLASNGDVKSFTPATLLAILTFLFQHRADLLQLIDAAKTAWLKFLAVWRLRQVIRHAIREASPLGVKGNAPDGFEAFLMRAPVDKLERLQGILRARPKA